MNKVMNMNNNLLKSQIKQIINISQEYLSKDHQSDCFCDYARDELIDDNFEAYCIWRDHRRAAFNTSPDYTGDLIYALDYRKYRLCNYFPDNKLEGEYGAARRRLVGCVITYFQNLLNSNK